MKLYYESKGIHIYHGDAMEALDLGTFDLLLTDPPYGIGEAAGKNRSRSRLATARDYGNDAWDNTPVSQNLLDRLRALAKWQIIFGGNYYRLPPSSCWLVWDKDNGENDFADCELAWTNLPKAVRRLRWRWAGMLQENMGRRKEPRFHPCQKPVEVMQWAISHVPEARTIFDPFMGSGSILRAAKDLGLKAVGVEREEKYCQIAAERMAQEVLFA